MQMRVAELDLHHANNILPPFHLLVLLQTILEERTLRRTSSPVQLPQGDSRIPGLAFSSFSSALLHNMR